MATRAAGDAYWERTDLERRILEAMRAVMEAAGFAVHAWDDVTGDAAHASRAADMPPHSAPRIMMGDRLDTILDASRRNQNERRIVMIQAVLQRR